MKKQTTDKRAERCCDMIAGTIEEMARGLATKHRDVFAKDREAGIQSMVKVFKSCLWMEDWGEHAEEFADLAGEYLAQCLRRRLNCRIKHHGHTSAREKRLRGSR